MSQDRKRHRECVTKFALEKRRDTGKKHSVSRPIQFALVHVFTSVLVLCRSRLSSSTLLYHWLVSRAGRAPEFWYVINVLSSCVRLYNREQNRRPLHIAEFARTILGMAVSSRMDSGNSAKTDPPSVIIFRMLSAVACLPQMRLINNDRKHPNQNPARYHPLMD